MKHLEATLGKSLPRETAAFLRRPLSLHHPDADHPEVSDASWTGKLPDVGAWLTQLGKPFEGTLQAIHHFCGLYPIGVKLDRGDFMSAFVVLEPYAGSELGGVMYGDEREIGTWGPTVSAFLMKELRAFWSECDGARREAREDADEDDADDVEDLSVDDMDLRDCFIFDDYENTIEPPEVAKLPASIEKAWESHWRSRMANHRRRWVTEFIGGDVADAVRFIPNENEWKAEKAKVAQTHHDAMYWLLAHWLLLNQGPLDEAVTLAKKNPSKLVAAVVAFVTSNDASKRYVKQRAELVRLVKRATHA